MRPDNPRRARRLLQVHGGIAAGYYSTFVSCVVEQTSEREDQDL